MKTEIGGDRLGSGNKEAVSLKNYSRSTHDLGYIWRSSMSSGTLVPFMSEVALPGDSFDIDLDVDVKTLPTVGPLFGSYKVQLDVFQCPVRLYQGKLHMNMLNIGMDMSQILLPQIEMFSYYDEEKGDNQQINSSSIYSYLNMRGLGRSTSTYQKRWFNGIPYLGYWDIYKNYYANKQEERGYVIHASEWENGWDTYSATFTIMGTYQPVDYNVLDNPETVSTTNTGSVSMTIVGKWASNDIGAYGTPDVEKIKLKVDTFEQELSTLFTNITYTEVLPEGNIQIECTGWIGVSNQSVDIEYVNQTIENTTPVTEGRPQLTEFPLDNIDDMRMDILEAVRDTNGV